MNQCTSVCEKYTDLIVVLVHGLIKCKMHITQFDFHSGTPKYKNNVTLHFREIQYEIQ